MTSGSLPQHLAIQTTTATDGGQSFAGINLGTINYGSSEINSKLNDLLQKTLPVSADASFSSRKREHEATCLPGTRSDLLHDIYNWVDGESSQSIFWLNGLPGTGKSTIAQTVATTYSAKKALGASFFFSRGGGDLRYAEKFVTTIAFQLANAIPDLKCKICDAISERSDIVTQSLRDQWQDLVLSPLLSLDGKDYRSKYALVIDALDECEDQNDIQIILQLLAELRVLLTSRPEVPIRHGFNQIHKDEHQDFVLHGISASIVDRDISVFLGAKLGFIRRKYQFRADWPEESAITSLVRSSVGLFIWAATACRFIEQGGQLAQARLLLLLHETNDTVEPARKLEEIYTTVLTNSVRGEYDEKETLRLRVLFRQVVGPIVISPEPLSVSILAKILGKDFEALNLTLSNLHSVLYVPEAESGTVRLLHPSFRDFLLDQKRCSNPQFYIDEKLAHGEMYLHCLRVMSEHLRRDICNLQLPGADITELSRIEVAGHIQPHVQYACRFWVYHYKRSYVDIDGYHDIEKFLRVHFLHWIEALAVLGCASDAVAMVHMLDSGFSNKREERPQGLTRLRGKFKSIFSSNVTLEETARLSLHALIHDAVRLILNFRPVLEVAPLQIYSAGLIFSPNTSIIKKNFSENVPQWVSCVTGVSENWSPHLQTLKGHLDCVNAVAFSPDGNVLVSVSDDKTVKLWDAGSGKPLQTLRGHSNCVNAVAFSPDGKILVSASYDKTVKLWDAGSGKPLQTLRGHSGSVNTVAFSPDGKVLVSTSNDETVKLWDARLGKLLQTLGGYLGSVNALAFSPDGKVLASASSNKSVTLWDPWSRKSLQTFRGHSAWVKAVAFSPDGKLLASAAKDKTVKLWDVGSGRLLQTFEIYNAIADRLSFTNNGSHLLIGDRLVPIGIITSQGPYRRSSPQSILVEQKWVLQNNERLLWLPAEYRPGVVAIHSDRVGFGYRSGRVLIMTFTN